VLETGQEKTTTLVLSCTTHGELEIAKQALRWAPGEKKETEVDHELPGETTSGETSH